MCWTILVCLQRKIYFDKIQFVGAIAKLFKNTTSSTKIMNMSLLGFWGVLRSFMGIYLNVFYFFVHMSDQIQGRPNGCSTFGETACPDW